MECQTNDAPEKSWVLRDHHPLWKKGVGCGMHQSNIICSSIGWLKEGSQSLEYGKNYDSYWNGELFVKQVLFMILYLCIHFTDSLPPSGRRKLFQHLNEHMVWGIKLTWWWITPKAILLIRRMHCVSHRWMWDLVGSRLACTMAGIFEMGKGLFNPWFSKQIMLNTQISWKESKQSSQNMDSIKELSEGNLPVNVIPIKLTAATKWILKLQPDFQQQESLIQEVIEATDHLCIFMPKFWDVVKKYLCENCDYTFDTLKENLPKALESVKLEVIHHGSIVCTGGWMLTDQGLAWPMHRCM